MLVGKSSGPNILQGQVPAGEVEAWIKAHWLLDPLLHIAALVVLTAIILAALSMLLYSAWFVLRLVRPANVATFIKKDIPTRVKGTVAGTGVEVGEEVARALPAFEHQTTETLSQLEARISKLETQFDLWEDTAGRA